MMRTLAGILLCGGLLWATPGEPIQGIDISVGKKPKPKNSSTFVATSDGSGRVRFDIADPGDYTIYATQRTPPATAVGLILKGIFTPIGAGAAGALVTGANLNGATLMAAGSTGPGREQIFSVDITVNGAVHFSGQFFAASPVTTNTNHLTFYAVENGPPPLPQTVQILNNSAAAVPYAASVQLLASQWAVNLSQASGTVDPGSSAGISVQPVVQGLKRGTYNALLHVTPDGRTWVAATLVVRAPGATAGTIGLDQVMAASLPQSNGTLPPTVSAVFNVSNQDASTQTYTVKLDPATGSSGGATFQPAQFTLAPGQSQDVVGTLADGTEYRQILLDPPIRITASSGAVGHVWIVPIGAGATGGACTPTQLLPVVNQIDSVARPGYPLNLTLQAYDNCGNPYSDFTTSVSVGNGSQQDLLAVKPSKGTVVKSPFTIHWRASVACCSYISPGPAGLTLTVAIEADNPLGGTPLTGSVQMPVDYESDASAPIVSEGGTVSAASFESVAIAPLEFFSTFGVFPGVNPTSAQTVPLGTSLGGVQVLFDGQPVPLYFVSGNQINGVVPGGALPGPHRVAAIVNGILSGTTTVMVGDANPAPFTSDGTTPFLVKGDGTLVSPSNPAKVGDTLVMYVQGLGLSSVPVQEGVPAPSVLLPATLPVDLLIGGQPQKVLYAGFTPGSVSLAQINFTVTSAPAVTAGGKQGLSMQIKAGSNVGPLSAVGNFVPDSTLSTVSISVQANYPDAQFNVNSNLITGNSGILTFNAGTQIPLDVPADPQQPSAGTRYYFYGWSQGGNRSQTIAPASSVAIGAYFLASYLLTANGTASMSPSSLDGYYTQTPSIFLPVTVTGSCPGGASPTGLLVNAPSGSITVPNGATIIMDAPKTVTVQCPPPKPTSCVAPPSSMIAWYSLDETSSPAHDIAPSGGGANAAWVGNPTPIAGMVAGALSFGGNNQSVQAVNTSEGDIGTGDMSADAWIKTTSMQDQSIVAKGFGYSYSSQYKGYRLGMYAGNPYFTFGDGNAGIYYFSHTFVADAKWHHVAATLSRSSTTGGTLYVDGLPVLVFDATPNPASWSNSEPLTIGGDQGSFLYNGLGFRFNGAIDEVEIFSRALSATEVGQIYAAGSLGKCKSPQTFPVTVNTNPLNIGVTVGLSPSTPGYATDVYTTSVPAGPYQATSNASAITNTAGDTKYVFRNWSLNSTPNLTWNNSNSTPVQNLTGPTTFTANYDTQYKVTLVLNGCIVGQTNVPGLSGSNAVFVAANSLVNVIASATLPNVFQSIAAVPATNASVNANGVTINPLTGPVTITANCAPAQNVTLTVATNPTGLQARIGTSASYAAAPISQQVPANQTQTISVIDPQFVAAAGTGYSFTGWSTGGSTAVTTVQPSSNFTATASFKVACYTLTVSVSPANSGTVAANPASGGLAGLPQNCYAPGTVVTLTATGANGTLFQSWTGATGTTNPTTVTVNAATTVVANFVPPPILSVALTSRPSSNANLSMEVRNTGGSAAPNVMVTAITNITSPSATFVYSPGLLVIPFVIPGAANLKAGDASGFNLFFQATTGSATAPFSFTITVKADNVAPFTTTINVP
ncbi:MAG TPA: LamG-like jellyroll fold domain-containing protein [Bryobacteraceae bacterium]|nr:LamG-like jellyroll fold domain-containing protein [Bryobacteraceae bacterium]